MFSFVYLAISAHLRYNLTESILTFTLQFTEYASDDKSWYVFLLLVGFNALVSPWDILFTLFFVWERMRTTSGGCEIFIEYMH